METIEDKSLKSAINAHMHTILTFLTFFFKEVPAKEVHAKYSQTLYVWIFSLYCSLMLG